MRTLVDWYAIRCREHLPSIEQSLRRSLEFGPHRVRIEPKRAGWQGYRYSANVLLDDMDCGLVAWGAIAKRVGPTSR